MNHLNLFFLFFGLIAFSLVGCKFRPSADSTSDNISSSIVTDISSLDSVRKSESIYKSADPVAKLLGNLSKEFLFNYTLVYDPEGIRQGGDAANPRAILFKQDGSLILTFIGAPKFGDYNHIHVISSQGEGFDFYDIDLKKPDQPLTKNPAECADCHTKYLPIWGSYDRWTGVYGSKDDGIYGSEHSKEFDDFTNKYMPNAVSHARYKQLLKIPGSKVSPYADEFRVGDTNYRPNLRLGKVIAKYLAKRLFSIVSADESKFGPYLVPLAYAVQCASVSKPKYNKVLSKIFNEQKIETIALLSWGKFFNFTAEDIFLPDPFSKDAGHRFLSPLRTENLNGWGYFEGDMGLLGFFGVELFDFLVKKKLFDSDDFKIVRAIYEKNEKNYENLKMNGYDISIYESIATYIKEPNVACDKIYQYLQDNKFF